MQFCCQSKVHENNYKSSVVCVPGTAQEQGEMDLNRNISINEIEPIINNLLQLKHQAQMGSLMHYSKHLRKKL